MFRNVNRTTAHVISCVLFLIAVIGCGNLVDSVSSQRSVQRSESIIFDSGLGTGQYDKMTYFEYGSEIAFTPREDMTIRSIRPRLWYCNGTSGFLAFIRDEHAQPIASEAGLIDEDDYGATAFSERHLDSIVTLRAGSLYLIVMSVWTTESVGIFTTGNRSEGTVGLGRYVVHYAKSNTAEHLDRGGIAFQLVQ